MQLELALDGAGVIWTATVSEPGPRGGNLVVDRGRRGEFCPAFSVRCESTPANLDSSDSNGERGRNRTFNLLIKSEGVSSLFFAQLCFFFGFRIAPERPGTQETR